MMKVKRLSSAIQSLMPLVGLSEKTMSKYYYRYSGALRAAEMTNLDSKELDDASTVEVGMLELDELLMVKLVYRLSRSGPPQNSVLLPLQTFLS